MTAIALRGLVVAPLVAFFVVSGCGSSGIEETQLSQQAVTCVAPDPESPAPVWTVGTSYVVGSTVTFEGATFQCLQAHTATVGWEPAVAASLWFKPTPCGLTEWAPQTAYPLGAQVTFGGQTFQCLQAHTSYLGWEPPNVPALWAVVQAP